MVRSVRVLLVLAFSLLYPVALFLVEEGEEVDLNWTVAVPSNRRSVAENVFLDGSYWTSDTKIEKQC